MSINRVAKLTSLALNVSKSYSGFQNFARVTSKNYFLLNKNLYSTQSNQSDSTNNEFDEEKLKKSILEKSMKYVPEDGFTFDAILKGILLNFDFIND